MTDGDLSVEEILSIVFAFGEAWHNNPTDCDDTDGRIHINSIYTKLQENLKEEAKVEEKSSFYPKGFFRFYLIFLVVLFALYVWFVGGL